MYALGMKTGVTASSVPPEQDREIDADLMEAFLTASRVLVAVAARSFVASDAEISLLQHRALDVPASHGAQRITDLAELLGVTSSTVTRHCDRLQRRELVRREPGRRRPPRRAGLADRRRAAAGPADHRRAAPPGQLDPADHARQSREALLAALRSSANAAGEVPERSWSLGWGTTHDTTGTTSTPTPRGALR